MRINMKKMKILVLQWEAGAFSGDNFMASSSLFTEDSVSYLSSIKIWCLF